MQLLNEAEASAESPSLASQDSEALLAAFERSGDDCAFEELVRRHSPAVFATCRQLTRNAHDAEDAAQAVFLTLAVQARTTNGIENVGGWLQQVAKNTSLNLCRSRRRRKAREQKEARESSRIDRLLDPHPAQAASVGELRAMLRAEVNQLPPKYRLPLILHYFGGMKPQEVAREINCTTQALAVRLFRARKMLAEQLARRGLALGGATLSLAVVEIIINGLAKNISPTTAYATEVGPSSGASAGSWAVRIARLCAGAAMSARFKLAVFAVLVVSTALAESLRGGSDLRLSAEWQLRPMIHSAIEKLRGYFHGAAPQPAAPTAPTPFTHPIDPEARAHPAVPNLLPSYAPSFGVGSPHITQPIEHKDAPFHDWLANTTPASRETTAFNGPVTLTGSVAHAASAYSAGLDAPAAVASAQPRSRAEVAVAIAGGRTFAATPGCPVQGPNFNVSVAGSVDVTTTLAETEDFTSTTSAMPYLPGSIVPPHHHHPVVTTLPSPVITPSAGGTPEPTSISAIAAALLFLTNRRRRK